MLSRWVGASLLCVFWTGAAAARAGCIYAPTAYHRVNPELERTHSAAPESPVLVEVEAFRRSGMTCTSASCVASSCGATGTVRISLAPAAGEPATAGGWGVRLELVSGVLPESMREMIGVDLDGEQPVFLRPRFDEVPSLDVTLQAVAIDAAGNESPPSEPFPVRFAGCTLAAIGDLCEDELAPDADLSALFGAADGELDEPAVELEGSPGGFSCGLGARRADTSALAALLSVCSLLAGARFRRRACRPGR